MAASAETALTFSTDDGSIFDPIKIKSEWMSPDSVEITVTNMATESVNGLGLYLRPTSNLGPWDNPAEQPPASDYQDILMWGTRSEIEPDVFRGGVKIIYDDKETWVSRSAGGYYTNRIPLKSLSPSAQLSFKVEFVVPQSFDGADWSSILDARRMFVSVVVA